MPLTARTRRALWAWAVLCALVVAVLAVVVHYDLLGGVDEQVGDAAFDWTAAQDGLVRFLLFVDAAFGTIAMTIYTGVGRGAAASRASTAGRRTGPSG